MTNTTHKIAAVLIGRQTAVIGITYFETAPLVTGEILHVDGGQSVGH